MAKAAPAKKQEEENETKAEIKEQNTTFGKQQPRVINHPNDVAALLMTQLNAVNAKKDELTMAIKGLADLTMQLVRVYGAHVQTIQQLAARIKELESKDANKT
jgi:hypothetical protein